MITERVMAAGSWSLRLRPDTPLSVLDKIDIVTKAFGHVIITPIHIPGTAVSGATLLGLARYTGMYRARPSEYEMSGPGLVAWLGDEDGKGDVIEANGAQFGASTFQDVVAGLRPVSLDAGAVQALGGSYTNVFSFVSRRAALDAAMDYFGAEYRVNPDGTLDAGTQSNLYPTTTTPTAVVQRRSGGKDLNITGVRATKMDTAKDMEDYTTRVVLLGDGATGAADISPATTFRDLNGNLVEWARVIEGTNVGVGNEATVAQAQLNRFTSARRVVTLSSDAYDIGTDIAAGDTIYVWDQDLDLSDTANQVRYRGETIFPLKMRVHGTTWPVQQGMGVYFRAPTSGGEITDLTEWIAWESGDTTIDVGAAPRASSTTQTPGNIGIETPLGLVPTEWSTYTPALTSTGTAPAMNSANRKGRYVRLGKMITAFVRMKWAGGDTVGTGDYRVSLPFAAASIYETFDVMGSGGLQDSGTAQYVGTPIFVTSTTVALYLDGQVAYGAAAPVVPAAGDFISLVLTYEAA